MVKMNPVVHFEMPAIEKKRVKRFYETAFGWKMTQLGEDMRDYHVATTYPVDKNNMHKKREAINGGFFQRGRGGTMPHIIISVDDLKKSMDAVKKSGGENIGKPMNIPGIGDFIMFKDTEGNRVGMLQPRMKRK